MTNRLALAMAFAGALAGCVAVPAQQYALVRGADGAVTRHALACQDANPAPIAGAALDPRAVRIASWNLHKQGDPGWESELDRLAGRSEIVLLQEVKLAPDLRATVERSGQFWVLASSFAYAGDEYGVLTAARVLPVAACTLRAYEPLLGIPKSALIAYFAIAGVDATLAVANLHAINFTLGTTAYSAQLDAVADALAMHRGPIVVAGDFNTWSEDRAAVVRAFAARLSLTPVPFAPDDRRRFLDRVFDWIYVRGVEVGDASAWAVSSSDHNPLWVTLRVR